MSETRIPKSEITKLLHENSENRFRHTSYREENRRYHLLMQGDMAAVDEAVRISNPEIQGKLSSDPVRNMRYLFIIGTGLATRYMIEAGVPQERVYSLSDLYIQKADVLTTEKELKDLVRECWTEMVGLVRQHKNEKHISKPILTCLNYIDANFSSRITLKEIADQAGMHPNYLATVFKEELGESFGSYLMRRRIDTARALLTRTEYTYSQIAYSLAFCSQSHFIKVFRKNTGFTPRQYRMQFSDSNFVSSFEA
ncbi:MAG: helix-turn-helix transcriptional regulator [Clostridiales bacterium]|nr:helix-turn-helix transcriptional regulator [Clostridiales bacterium]